MMKANDGRGATSTEPVSEEQVAKLQERILNSGGDVVNFCRSFGITTLHQLPAAEYVDAIALLARIERLGKYSAALHYMEEIEIEPDSFFERVSARSKAGMDWDKAYHLSLAEELAKNRPWPQWLLEFCAVELLAQYKPLLEAQWERKVRRPAVDREMIDYWAERLKAQGVSNPRGAAEQTYAESQNRSVHALRKRHQRSRKK